jgi:hypothetical protein
MKRRSSPEVERDGNVVLSRATVEKNGARGRHLVELFREARAVIPERLRIQADSREPGAAHVYIKVVAPHWKAQEASRDRNAKVRFQVEDEVLRMMNAKHVRYGTPLPDTLKLAFDRLSNHRSRLKRIRLSCTPATATLQFLDWLHSRYSTNDPPPLSDLHMRMRAEIRAEAGSDFGISGSLEDAEVELD